ncbi:hypothetical protein [Novipirellula sp.]|uniref:hypothetical protein n=1 Tax=Novipirellula sp. TaxID=2795430 RepID=UPI00356709A6
MNTERLGDTSIIAGGRTRLVKAITKAKTKFENSKKSAFLAAISSLASKKMLGEGKLI